MYMDKDIIRKIAPKVSNISYDIDFFEYSEKKGYTTNNNTCIRPEVESKGKHDKEAIKKIGFSEDYGVLCNTEIIKRYINIEDVSSIKNNNFYYNILENLKEDNRVKNTIGRITKLDDGCFYIGEDKYIISSEGSKMLLELFDNNCELTCVGFKINCLNSQYNVFKTIAIYIE